MGRPLGVSGPLWGFVGFSYVAPRQGGHHWCVAWHHEMDHFVWVLPFDVARPSKQMVYTSYPTNIKIIKLMKHNQNP